MNTKRIIPATLLVASIAWMPAATAAAATKPDPKDVCKNGGYQTLAPTPGASAFRNQGQCVSFVAQGGTPVPVGSEGPPAS